MEPTQILFEAASRMGVADHVSFNGRLVTVTYSPKAEQRPLPERLDERQARQIISEMVKSATNR